MKYMTSRFAPSPTGDMHMGNARTALFNKLLLANDDGGNQFILRIEDTDCERSKSHYIDGIIEDLRWLGLDWQQGPDMSHDYLQSNRAAIYDKFYKKLAEMDLVYPCFCSEEELKLNRALQRRLGKPPRYSGKCRHLTEADCNKKLANGLKSTLRFKFPKEGAIEFEDLAKGRQLFHYADMGDFIIRRTDGSAPFMYCNAIDDALMGVTHVLRGEDHLSNTPRQIAILSSLGLSVPTYIHIALILGCDHKPLSKRNGSRSIRYFREAGFLPTALMNYMARLGHRYGDNQLMDLTTLGRRFSLSNFSKSASHYDEAQLLYWQKQAVMALSIAEIMTWLGDDLLARVPKDKQTLFCQLVGDSICFPKEAADLCDILFSKPFILPAAVCRLLTDHSQLLQTMASLLKKQDDLDFNVYKKELMTITKLKGKALFMPLRLALTGQSHGPDLGAIFSLLSQTELISRLENAVDF